MYSERMYVNIVRAKYTTKYIVLQQCTKYKVFD